jgi:hypothetical protein
MANATIKVLPTEYADVMALLKSAALHAVEEPIAAALGMKIVYDDSSSSVSIEQAWLSVSGMTCPEIQRFLLEHRDALIRFGIRLQQDQQGKPDEQEYPAGEEPDEADKDQIVEVRGLANGFGARMATYYNFLANRTPAELLAFLKNRRIASRFARDLRRIFTATGGE